MLVAVATEICNCDIHFWSCFTQQKSSVQFSTKGADNRRQTCENQGSLIREVKKEAYNRCTKQFIHYCKLGAKSQPYSSPVGQKQRTRLFQQAHPNRSIPVDIEPCVNNFISSATVDDIWLHSNFSASAEYSADRNKSKRMFSRTDESGSYCILNAPNREIPFHRDDSQRGGMTDNWR